MAGAPRQIAPGVPAKGHLGAGQVDVFDIQCQEGEFLQLQAAQQGQDVLLRLYGPDGLLLAEVDSPNGAGGVEAVTEVTAAGSYRVEVYPIGSAPDSGVYSLELTAPRAATDADLRRVAAERSWNRGEVLRRRGMSKGAFFAYCRSYRQWKALGVSERQAACLYRMGWMRHDLKLLVPAVKSYDAALDLLAATGDPRVRAAILNRRGRALHELGRMDLARAAFEQALTLSRSVGDETIEATALQNLGELLATPADAAAAFSALAGARDLWQKLGNAAEAANTLRHLDRLREPRGGAAAPGGAAGGDDETPAGGWVGPGFGEAQALTRVAASLARSGKMEEAAQWYGGALAPGLDGDTLVLRYELGDGQSALWTATASGGPCRHHPLPGRADIEAAARRLFEVVAQAGAEAARERCQAAAGDLSRMLLAPAAAELQEGRRLVLIVDGCLDRVPFAMLPAPEPEAASAPAASRPLLERHAIVHLPASLAAAALNRRQTSQTSDTFLQVRGPVVVGGPVLCAADPRLAAAAAASAAAGEVPAPLAAALAHLGLPGLPCLPFSLPEAEAIIAQGVRFGLPHALGFDASVDLLRGGALRGILIQHIAGLVVLAEEGSGLVLSCFDRNGRPRAGYLPLSELGGLDLTASLLVVTGTRLAWGAAEGGLGLVQAAMRAGAAKVVTSLWSADDESAVELMRRFYEALATSTAPAEALRSAQLAIAADPRWSSPRHWAGFLFSGDWSTTRRAETGSYGGRSIEANDTGGTGVGGNSPNDMPGGSELSLVCEEGPIV
jgi:CHAT domain-containing protein